MTVSADRLLETIEKIYAAPMADGGWTVALRSISELLGAGMTTYSGNFDNSAAYSPSYMLRDLENTEAFQQYMDYYHTICERGRYSQSEPVGTVYYDYKYFTETEMRRSEYYDYLARYGGKYALGATLGKPTSSPVHLGTQQFAVHFSDKHGHPEREQIDLVERLVPHLMRANLMAQQLGVSRGRLLGLQSALDVLPTAVIGLTADFTVEFANRRAEHLLNKHDGISIRNRQLSLWSSKARAWFAHLTSAIAAGGMTTKIRRSLMPVERPSAARPYVVFITPAVFPGEYADDVLARRIEYLVIINDPDDPRLCDSAGVATALGLTTMEANLAASLAEGATLKDFCDRTGMKMHTARWHLKNIQAKTDTHRQADLVRLICGISAPEK